MANVKNQQIAIVSQGGNNYRWNLAVGNHRYNNVLQHKKGLWSPIFIIKNINVEANNAARFKIDKI